MRSIRPVLATLFVMGAALAVTPVASSAGSPHLSVRELSGEAHVKATVTFTKARCQRGTRRAQIAYLVTAKSTNKRWSLAITFPRFTGRHRYEIPFGSSDTDPHVTFTGPDGEFSSLNVPRDRSPVPAS